MGSVRGLETKRRARRRPRRRGPPRATGGPALSRLATPRRPRRGIRRPGGWEGPETPRWLPKDCRRARPSAWRSAGGGQRVAVVVEEAEHHRPLFFFFRSEKTAAVVLSELCPLRLSLFRCAEGQGELTRNTESAASQGTVQKGTKRAHGARLRQSVREGAEQRANSTPFSNSPS